MMDEFLLLIKPHCLIIRVNWKGLGFKLSRMICIKLGG